MFLLGHTGIGAALARRFVAARSFPWLLLGTLLPDLIDKPLYYGLAAATGRRAADLGLVSGTRTFGHTAIFLLVTYAILRLARRREIAAALALGMATHLLLDEIGDLFATPRPPGVPGGPPTIAAILFPLLGARFPVMPFKDAAAHAGSIANPWLIAGEIIGGLFWLWWLRRYWKERAQKRYRGKPAA